jgi:hypothetical protein
MGLDTVYGVVMNVEMGGDVKLDAGMPIPRKV